MAEYIQRCVACGKEHDQGFYKKCAKCNGAIDLFYDLDSVQFKKSVNPYKRFFDLLPIKNEKNILWVGDGNTPLIHSKKIGKEIGLKNLYLKFEGANPTCTTKDRVATVSLSFLNELGVHEFVLSSTGNIGTAYAYGVAKFPFFTMHLVYHGSPKRLNFREGPHIKVYKIKGDFVKACSDAKEFAEKNNLVFEGGFFNASRREGLKIAMFEVYEEIDQEPDWYFQAISSAMGLYGVYKGCKELKEIGKINKVPKMAGVQQHTCNPMYKAWKENSPVIKKKHIVKNPEGIAKAILRGDPTNTYPYIYELVKESEGTIESVSRTEIISAQKILLKKEKLNCSPESGVALAAVIKMAKEQRIEKDEVILVNLSGGVRPTNVYPKEFIYI